mgnify:CR=1 FL=1
MTKRGDAAEKAQKQEWPFAEFSGLSCALHGARVLAVHASGLPLACHHTLPITTHLHGPSHLQARSYGRLNGDVRGACLLLQRCLTSQPTQHGGCKAVNPWE